MFQTSFCGTASLPLCRILCFKLTTEPPKEQAQRWSFCITVFFISMTFYEFSHKSAQKPLLHAADLKLMHSVNNFNTFVRFSITSLLRALSPGLHLLY